MLSKSTRAFRTISEAGDELDLQPHVLRFWESKFAQIQPMKRSGGRRFYRPEDIEFLRGIKILLHREKHPIKDVQKLIRIKGAQSVVELGRSIEKASKPRDIKDTDLVPRRIKPVPVVHTPPEPEREVVRRVVPIDEGRRREKPSAQEPVQETQTSPIDTLDRDKMKTALEKLRTLKNRWEEFK